MSFEIRVYSPALERIGSIEDHESLIWTRRYFEPGEFELHAPITRKNLEYLQPGNIITMKGSPEAGVIEHVINEENHEKNIAARRGRFLSSYLDRRLIKNTVQFSGTPEEVMRKMLDVVAPIPLLQKSAFKGIAGERIELQATMKNLLTYESKMAKASGLGFRVRPDFRNKVLLFEVYEGIDRTQSSGEYGRVVFSEKYENVNNVVYTYNDQLSKTVAIVGGEGEGTDRVYVTVGNAVGLDLRETFVDAKDIRSEGLTVEEYKAALQQRGVIKLKESGVAESLEPTVDADKTFVYKEHYDIGDIVAANKESWGFGAHKRITEIKEIYEGGAFFVVPTFGDALPETIDWGDG